MPSPTTWSDVITVPFTGGVWIDSLIYGSRWANTVITYSFPTGSSYWSTDPSTGYGPSSGGREPWLSSFASLSPSDQIYFAQALAAWGNVANLQFVQVADTSSTVGDIRAAYGYQFDKSSSSAWAYTPGDTAVAGDVWFNIHGNSATTTWTPGSFAFQTAVHEIGHTLGLKHPFSSPTTLPTAYDSILYTVMSYSAVPGNQNSGFSFYPTTPMVLDIQAIQYLYGANYSYHSGDDVYTFTDSQTYFQTIWDGGGGNIISYTGSQAAYIDLHEGSGSSIGNPVYSLVNGTSPQRVNNVWIAFGTQIYGAAGGSAGDTIVANDGGNYLYGAGGNDSLQGGAAGDILEGGSGSDTLSGGGGHDIAMYASGLGHFTVTKTATGFQVKDLSGFEGTDVATSVEEFDFSDLLIDTDITAAASSVSAATLKNVIELYVAFFNRVPDSEGMTYWLQQASHGTSVTSIANSFYSAALAYSNITGYSPTMTNADFVTIVYKNVLGRTSVDAGGLQYWTTALANGTESRGTLVQSILNSAHTFKGDATWGWVADLLDNKYTVGKLFAVDMGLSYVSPQDSITHGMQIAAAVTPTSTTAAVSLIGVPPANIHLT